MADCAAGKLVSTHSRLKAAGLDICAFFGQLVVVSTHSRLKAAGSIKPMICLHPGFQHTAA